MSVVTPSQTRGRGRRALAVGVTAGLVASLVAAAPAAQAASVPTTPNPDLAVSCGLDVVLVLDESASIANSSAEGQVKAAANTFLKTFEDTNSRVGIVKFATRAKASVPLTYVTTTSTSVAGVHGSAIASYAAKMDGATNWQDAMVKANGEFTTAPARNVPKLLVFVTDGAPRVYNLPGGAVSDLQPEASDQVVDPAVLEVNSFKATGGHALAVGVGKAFNTGPLVADRRAALQAISETSSPDIYPTDPYDSATTDVILQPDFTQLSNDLSKVATQICDGSLTVTERTTTARSPLKYSNYGAGWNVTTTVNPAGDWIKPTNSITTGPTQVGPTDRAGTSVFQWLKAGDPTWTKTATVDNGTKQNYAIKQVRCSDKNGLLNPQPALTGPKGNEFSVTVGAGNAIACTVYSKWTGPLASLLSLTPKAKTALYGATATTLVGKLRNPLKPLVGKKVLIQSKVGRTGTWRTIATRTTNKNGAFSKKVKPSINRSFRATYAGGKTQYPGVSNLSVIRVKPRVSLVLSKTSVVKGAKVTFAGSVAPNRRGTPVYLQRYSRGSWHTVKSTLLTSTSKYVFRYTTTSRVDYRWRVMRPSGDLYAAGVSRKVTLTVR